MSIPLKRVHRESLPALIAGFCEKGARPMTVTLRTIKDLSKKESEALDTPELIKISRVGAFLNFDYTKSVNRQLKREGKEANFKTRGCSFEHVEGDPRPIVRNKQDHNKVYLQLKLENKLGETYLTADGKLIETDKVNSALRKHGKPNQGTDKPIITITPALSSVISIVCDGEEYSVVD